MSTDKSSGVANETIASDADGSGWERLSDMSDHELAKHIMNELSSLLAGLGVPGNRPTSQLKLLGKAFKKKSLCLTRYVPWIRDLIKMRNDLTHAGPARAGLPDRSKFIKLFFEVKVCLLGLAQEKIPIRTRAGQSSQGFEEDAFADMMVALRLRVEMEAVLSPAECKKLLMEISVRENLQLDSMRPRDDPAAASERAASGYGSECAIDEIWSIPACAMIVVYLASRRLDIVCV